MTGSIPASEHPEQVLEFSLGEDRYCVDIERIEEIVKAEDVTALPDTPPEITGMMDLRGAPTTILDPATVFDVQTPGDSRQVVVFEGEQRFGWLVDRVHRVSTLSEVTVDSVPDSPSVSGLISDGDRFVIWVDPETVSGSVAV